MVLQEKVFYSYHINPVPYKFDLHVMRKCSQDILNMVY